MLANPLQAVQLLAAYQTRTQHQANADEPDGTGGRGYAEDQPLPDPRHDDRTVDDADAATGTNDGDTEAGETDCLAGNPFLRPEPFRPGDIPCCPHAQTHTGPDDAASTAGFRVDWAKLLPSVKLYLHLAATLPNTGDLRGGDSDDAGAEPWVGTVVRWEGEGPVTTSYLREVLGPWCRFTVKPVLDLTAQSAVTAYETPAWMREAVQLITGGDVYPYAPSTSRRLDLDHVHPYRPPDHGGPPGQTHPGNLAPLTRFHHRLKTHGGWQLREPFPGIYLWRAPHGSIFLVDHTGTRKITDPWHPADDTPTPVNRARAIRDDLAGLAPAATAASAMEQHFAALVLAA